MANINNFNVYGKEAAVVNTASIANSATQTFEVPYIRDHRTTLVVTNTDATVSATVTVKAGDSFRGKMGDSVTVIPAGKVGVISLAESSRFKKLSGEKKGCAEVILAGAVGKVQIISIIG